MDNPIVTILMPVYNAMSSIDKTIDAILKQTNPNFKVLIIDDCSTDGTYTYLKEKIKNDKRFTILKSPQNIGIGAMRDLLISKCDTKYFFFLDDDDFIYKNAMKKMIKVAEKTDADMITSKYKIKFVWKKLFIVIMPPFYKWCGIKGASDFLLHNMTFFWGYFVKKEYYDSLNLIIGATFYEDVFPPVKMFLNARSYAHANVYSIRYLRRKNSLSSYNPSWLEERLQGAYEGYKKACEFIYHSDEKPKYKAALISHKMYQYFGVLFMFYDRLDAKDKLKIIEHARNYFKPLGESVGWRPKFSLAPWKMYMNCYKKIVNVFKERA